jgi:hypothetical protein
MSRRKASVLFVLSLGGAICFGATSLEQRLNGLTPNPPAPVPLSEVRHFDTTLGEGIFKVGDPLSDWDADDMDEAAKMQYAGFVLGPIKHPDEMFYYLTLRQACKFGLAEQSGDLMLPRDFDGAIAHITARLVGRKYKIESLTIEDKDEAMRASVEAAIKAKISLGSTSEAVESALKESSLKFSRRKNPAGYEAEVEPSETRQVKRIVVINIRLNEASQVVNIDVRNKYTYPPLVARQESAETKAGRAAAAGLARRGDRDKQLRMIQVYKIGLTTLSDFTRDKWDAGDPALNKIGIVEAHFDGKVKSFTLATLEGEDDPLMAGALRRDYMTKISSAKWDVRDFAQPPHQRIKDPYRLRFVDDRLESITAP